MIYPSYSTIITDDLNWGHIRYILFSLYIHHIPDTSYRGKIFIDGQRKECIIGDANSPDSNTISFQEFTSIYEALSNKIRDFISSLAIGSKVVIDKRIGLSTDYPFSFSDPMTRYSSREVTIRTMRTSHSGSGRRQYNGVDIQFTIEEDGGSYYWHSSMFVLPDTIKAVDIINLSTIHIDISKLFKK